SPVGLSASLLEQIKGDPRSRCSGGRGSYRAGWYWWVAGAGVRGSPGTARWAGASEYLSPGHPTGCCRGVRLASGLAFPLLVARHGGEGRQRPRQLRGPAAVQEAGFGAGPLKARVVEVQRLGVPRTQQAVWGQQPAERRQRPPPGVGVEVDEQVPAEDEVERFLSPQEQRVEEVTLPEPDQRPDRRVEFPGPI